MRSNIAKKLDEPSSDSIETRRLIDQCSSIEKIISMEPGVLLTIDQASERLGISKQTLRNWEREGRAICVRTEGGHRRYQENHINDLRRKQASMIEIILPMVTPTKLKELGDMLISSFNPNEKINLIVSQDLDNRVKIVIDSEDGLTTVTKTFNVKD